jgi:hypothetical protein
LRGASISARGAEVTRVYSPDSLVDDDRLFGTHIREAIQLFRDWRKRGRDKTMSANGRGKLFEYAVVYHPKQTKDQLERGEHPKSVMVLPPQTMVAVSDKEVGMVAARGLPSEYVDKLDDVEILIRPF